MTSLNEHVRTLWPSVDAMTADRDEFVKRTGCEPTFDQLIKFRQTMDERVARVDEIVQSGAAAAVEALEVELQSVTLGTGPIGEFEVDIARTFCGVAEYFAPETLRHTIRELLPTLADKINDRTVDEHAIDILIEIRMEG